MSKIAEQKAIEMFPDIKWTTEGQIHHDGTDYDGRMGFELGYDQAFQDFIEKACEWLSKNARNYFSAYTTSNKLIEDFKNYMQDESEN